MISKNESKLIKSLQLKKYRDQHQLFIVEGSKSVKELLQSKFKIEWIIVTSSFLKENPTLIDSIFHDKIKVIKENNLSALGSFSTNISILAIAHIPPNLALFIEKKEYILMLDQIRDPGNLGTIIRTADWYGINKIICSNDCVDVYNPKVIAASMGSFLRTKIYYCNLGEYLRSVPNSIPVVGSFLTGESVYSFSFPSEAFLVMGNESNGIEPELLPFITHHIHIPSFGKAESLNVGIATSIIIDNWKRSFHSK